MTLCSPTSLWYLTNGPPSFGPQGRPKQGGLEEKLSIVGREKAVTAAPVKSSKKVGKAKALPAKAKAGKADEEAPSAKGKRPVKEHKAKAGDSQEGEGEESPAKAVLSVIRKERRRSSRLTSLIVDAAEGT